MRRLILEEGGHTYVCGDALMADGVKRALIEILSSKLGDDADAYMSDLLHNGRYHEDVFGAVHP